MCIRVLHTYSVWKKLYWPCVGLAGKVPAFISYVCHRCEPRVKKKQFQFLVWYTPFIFRGKNNQGSTKRTDLSKVTQQVSWSIITRYSVIWWLSDWTGLKENKNHINLTAYVLSCVRLFVTPWTVACQAPLSMRFFFLARILEWVAMPSSRGFFWPMDRTCVSCDSCIAGGFFITEPLGKPTTILGWIEKHPQCGRNQNQSCKAIINQLKINRHNLKRKEEHPQHPEISFLAFAILYCQPLLMRTQCSFPRRWCENWERQRAEFSWKIGSDGSPQGDLFKRKAGATQTFKREVKITPAGSCLRQIWADRSMQNCICQISINQIFPLFCDSHINDRALALRDKQYRWRPRDHPGSHLWFQAGGKKEMAPRKTGVKNNTLSLID